MFLIFDTHQWPELHLSSSASRHVHDDDNNKQGQSSHRSLKRITEIQRALGVVTKATASGSSAFTWKIGA